MGKSNPVENRLSERVSHICPQRRHDCSGTRNTVMRMQQEQIVRDGDCLARPAAARRLVHGAPEVTADGEEILVIGPLADGGGEDPVERARRFREETREPRVLAAELSAATGARSPVGRLRPGAAAVHHLEPAGDDAAWLPERRVLDTLIDAGVARSRSDALAWCVRLVGNARGRLDPRGSRARPWSRSSGSGPRVPIPSLRGCGARARVRRVRTLTPVEPLAR